MNGQEIEKEFERQVQILLAKDYPKLAGMSKNAFLDLVEPLHEKLKGLELPEVDLEKGKLPFVVVVKSELVSTEEAMGLVEKVGKNGITKLYPHDPQDFSVIQSVQIPDRNVYLLIDIDRGKESLNVRPQDALVSIQKSDRSPLSIDEGVAIVTQFPEFLIKNNCFSLLASRHAGDQRVPAIWINGQKHPNLGWCWDGNPHTWLGSASGAQRD